MTRSRLTACLLLTSTALSLNACDSWHKNEPAPTGSVTQHFTMIDAEGRNFGMVELDPVTGGKVVDAQGRFLGRIVTSEAPTVPVPAPIYTSPVAPAALPYTPVAPAPTVTVPGGQ